MVLWLWVIKCHIHGQAPLTSDPLVSFESHQDWTWLVILYTDKPVVILPLNPECQGGKQLLMMLTRFGSDPAGVRTRDPPISKQAFYL